MHAHDFWTDRLSEALDGTLPADQVAALEEHLAGCPPCRRVREELEEVRRRARALDVRPPEADLWARIAPALSTTRSGTSESNVIPMHRRPSAGPGVPGLQAPASGTARGPKGRGLRTAAAAVLLVATGALGGVWWSGPGGSPPAGVPAVPPTSDAPIRAAAGGAVEASLFAELNTLEQALLADLGRLDPETRTVILANLRTIDRAIRESVAALEADPGSRYLQGHLGSALHRKVGYLQSVTRLLES